MKSGAYKTRWKALKYEYQILDTISWSTALNQLRGFQGWVVQRLFKGWLFAKIQTASWSLQSLYFPRKKIVNPKSGAQIGLHKGGSKNLGFTWVSANQLWTTRRWVLGKRSKLWNCAPRDPTLEVEVVACVDYRPVPDRPSSSPSPSSLSFERWWWV